MGLSPATRSRLNRTEKLFLCVLFQVLLPAFPFAVPLIKYGAIPGSVWATGSAMYVLCMAAACKNKSAFGLGMLCGVLLIGLYGFDAASVNADLYSSEHVLPSTVMAIVGLTFLADRCYYHLVRGEGFGPFAGEREKHGQSF